MDYKKEYEALRAKIDRDLIAQAETVKAYEAEIKQLKDSNEWISVEEEPEDSSLVVTFIGYQGEVISTNFFNYCQGVVETEAEFLNEVTHYTLIPTPPKS